MNHPDSILDLNPDSPASQAEATGEPQPYCLHPHCPLAGPNCPDFCPLNDYPCESDRLAWDALSGEEWDIRQHLAWAAWRDGRRMGLAVVPLAVPRCYGEMDVDAECVHNFVEGWNRGRDEVEVEEYWRTWERLPRDEEPERS